MPEPFARCGECNATLAEHEDPEIVTCGAFRLETQPHLPGIVVTKVIPVADAERILADAGVEMRAVISRLEAQVDQVAADMELMRASLTEAEHANEMWGAFDFELLAMAEEANVDPEGLTPLELVRALCVAAATEATMEGAP